MVVNWHKQWAFLIAIWIGFAAPMTWVTVAWAAEPPVKIVSSNPFSGDPQAIAAGRDLYVTFCSQCHGGKADGVSTRFGKYAKDLRKFWKGYSQFVAIVVTGVKGKQMPPWGEYLSGDQISHIGAFLETLAIEGANWK